MSILFTLTLAVAATPARPHHNHLHRNPAPYRGAQLYSLAARRRFQAYLRLRLLEMHLEGLDRARAVIEHRLDVDSLIPRRDMGPGMAGKQNPELVEPASEEPQGLR